MPLRPAEGGLRRGGKFVTQPPRSLCPDRAASPAQQQKAEMAAATPTLNDRLAPRLGGFATTTGALDYAAQGETGMNFYSPKGELVEMLSYARLRDEARQAAARMIGAGLKPGDRVAIVAETHGDFARLFYGSQYARLVPVPLPLPATFGGRDAYIEQLRLMTGGCGARALFAPQELEAYATAAASRLPDIRVCGTIAALDAFPAATDLPAVLPSDLAYLQFSSGSTRFPAAAAVDHAAVMANATAIMNYGLEVQRGDRCSSWLPLYHDMGLIGFMITPMTCQISIDYIATREFARRPFLWLRLITENRATLIYGPSFGYDLCARRARTASIEGIDLSSVRCAGIGADMIRPHVLDGFIERFASAGFRREAFVPSYGLAEITLAISFAPVNRGYRVDRVDLDALALGEARPAIGEGGRARDFVLCGRPLIGHRIEVRDEDGRALPERKVGRIHIAGPSMMREYYGRPDETAAALGADGWLDTGDLGYWLGEQIVITGRAKDLIIVNGRNIWPQDLEWTVEHEVEGLRAGDVAAIAVDDGEKETVLLLVECRLRKPEERDSLIQRVKAATSAAHAVECDVALVPPNSLPQTSSGKLSRTRARQQYLAGGFDAPAAATAG